MKRDAQMGAELLKFLAGKGAVIRAIAGRHGASRVRVFGSVAQKPKRRFTFFS